VRVTRPRARARCPPLLCWADPVAAPLDRRNVLRVLAVASTAPTLLLPRRGRAASTAVRGIDRQDLGVTLELGMKHGPFPHAGLPYDDDTCLVFVPSHYRGAGGIDTVVHFHGHGTTARKTIVEKQLREQFHASDQNAILVVPQGPIDAKDSRWGKLELADGLLALLGEVRRAVQQPAIVEALGPSAIEPKARIGTTAISAHSGGYRVAASCLARGGWNVTEVYLFDALYGVRDDFRSWVLERRDRNAARERHKLVAWYCGSTVAEQCKALRRELDADGIAYRHVLDERKATKAEMARARVAFLRSSVGHRDVMHASDALRNCLTWSCFSRALGTK
jgi:hypothetical protein